MNDSTPCQLANGFSLREKLYAQITFFTMAIVGIIGIARADWPWLLPYLVVFGYGVPGIVMRHLTCPRCPHLFEHGDCLQFPPRWTLWLVTRRKATPFSAGERWLFHLIFVLLPIYPLYWLRAQPLLLAVFVAAAAMWYLGQWLYYCKRCRVKACPYNRVRFVASK
ncbi:MAG: hypothetical protein KJ634_01890 [Gammaproteobacteria bacterium]|nr:hypothetical protein [Gammaproteobacteria bacterium]MBU1414350.1 hypothetical protein [Gammaproteobacteria bacterium]